MNNDVIDRLCTIIQSQQELITSIADKLKLIESIGGGGGGGSASIEDYVPGSKYTRNMLLVDTNTETVYRVLSAEYKAITVDDDVSNGNLKLVGFENAIVSFNHDPTQDEINALPKESLVAVYSSTDSYTPLT